jgi:hypothetical protein
MDDELLIDGVKRILDFQSPNSRDNPFPNILLHVRTGPKDPDPTGENVSHTEIDKVCFVPTTRMRANDHAEFIHNLEIKGRRRHRYAVATASG